MGTGAPPAIAMTSTVENFGKTVGMCRASSLRNCYLGGTNYVTDFVYRRKGLCVEVAILVFTLPGFNVQIFFNKIQQYTHCTGFHFYRLHSSRFRV